MQLCEHAFLFAILNVRWMPYSKITIDKMNVIVFHGCFGCLWSPPVFFVHPEFRLCWIINAIAVTQKIPRSFSGIDPRGKNRADLKTIPQPILQNNRAKKKSASVLNKKRYVDTVWIWDPKNKTHCVFTTISEKLWYRTSSLLTRYCTAFTITVYCVFPSLHDIISAWGKTIPW